jgi:hypothetical protein
MGISNKDKSFNLLNKHSYSGSDLLRVNYCIPGIMSRCSAGLIWQDQKKCKFAKKSSVSNRCMHYIEPINGHCDSVEAQSELRNLDRFEDDG